HAACAALGHFAARSRHARRWVAGMYLGHNQADRFRSAAALRELLEFMPRFVAHLVSLRLRLAQKMPAFHGTDWERRENWLNASLDPLNSPCHAAAARAAQDVVSRLGPFIRDSQDWRQLLDLADVRGGLLFWRAEEREQIFAELESSDADTRF